ncbi:hypothetical protein L0152_24900 [bacterium]|nr:hypothetical protein [bacterium]
MYFASKPAAEVPLWEADNVVDGLFDDLVEVVLSSQLTQKRVARIANCKWKPNLIKLLNLIA